MTADSVRAELEEADRKLSAERSRAAESKRQEASRQEASHGWWARQDQTIRIFVGIGGLMIGFFICLWITNALQIHQAKEAVHDLAREATSQAKELTAKILPPVH